MHSTGSAPLHEDLRVFVAVTRQASFARAAQALGVSPAYVTKRVKALEATLGVQLLLRSTRTVAVTEQGERVYQSALTVLDAVDRLLDDVRETSAAPRGLIRICSSFGFGRNIVGPAISGLVARYPELQVRFEIFDRLVDVAAEGFDLDIRVGDEIAPSLIARKLLPNSRVLCAAPAYLAARGMPRSAADLARHDCLVIKERDHPFGLWRLRNAAAEVLSVKVTGPLSANNGEVATQWAIDGRGIVLRSLWDVGHLLRTGKLVQVLPALTQEANVYAVYPSKLPATAKTRVCVEWLHAALPALVEQHRRGGSCLS
ncbi:LysR substrate-binding domain-containing protein [Cupriavidus sp. 2TAF22]|uniref:LysR substrate-binding domain-containing protein n=1 Tax=unclassified Cupriavidus TaxID=2640874 RepID=UPI003F903C46